MKKMILIACEESQVECVAFRKRGFEAYSCDIQKCSGQHPEWHIRADVLTILPGHCIFITEDGVQHEIKDKWDLIIAHPPCTYLAKSSAPRMYKKPGIVDEHRLQKAIEARDFFMQCLNADSPLVAVENPVPLKIVKLPRPSCYVEPYWFGHTYSKKTLYWLKGLPPLMPNAILPDYISFVNAERRISEKSKKRKLPVANTAKNRSRSFPGIAEAMADQWCPFI